MRRRGSSGRSSVEPPSGKRSYDVTEQTQSDEVQIGIWKSAVRGAGVSLGVSILPPRSSGFCRHMRNVSGAPERKEMSDRSHDFTSSTIGYRVPSPLCKQISAIFFRYSLLSSHLLYPRINRRSRASTSSI